MWSRVCEIDGLTPRVVLEVLEVILRRADRPTLKNVLHLPPLLGLASLAKLVLGGADGFRASEEQGTRFFHSHSFSFLLARDSRLINYYYGSMHVFHSHGAHSFVV